MPRRRWTRVGKGATSAAEAAATLTQTSAAEAAATLIQTSLSPRNVTLTAPTLSVAAAALSACPRPSWTAMEEEGVATPPLLSVTAIGESSPS